MLPLIIAFAYGAEVYKKDREGRWIKVSDLQLDEPSGEYQIDGKPCDADLTSVVSDVLRSQIKSALKGGDIDSLLAKAKKVLK